jgi:hypothetical protein
MNPPDNNVYNPTNWDYAFDQTTLLNTPKDTPDASARALHWFLDAQPPAGSSNGQGSGGVYQQVAVQPGVPVQYSFWWKGAADSGTAWFEFMLIDGPFSFGEADLDQESASHNNPALLRKRTLSTVDTFAWQQVTDQSPADAGPAGPRQTTITPTGSIITVVLKAGRAGPGAMESFWDAVVISQNSGPNLLVNGDFESAGQLAPCENQYMFQNSCEGGYWTHSAFVACPTPFADTDDDQDVDQEDFGRFQACFAPGEPVSAECSCFDRPQPIQPNGSIDQADFAAFTLCITGPEVDWVSNVNCP